MRVELYHSPHCPACRALDRQPSHGPSIVRRDIGRHLEQAARLGISRVPALVVNGCVVAQGIAVRAALQRIVGAESKV